MRMLCEETGGIEILLVEDSSADIRLTKEVFETIDIKTSVHAVTNGEDAVNFLWKQRGHEAAPTPDLILLDLNIPKIDGRAVLKMIKEDERMRRIPVIVLTTSRNDEDLGTAYDYYANAYVVKPISFHDFSVLVRRLCDFWFGAVALPEKEYD